MVHMGRNLISKNTKGFWTKLEPEVPPGIPLSSSSKLSESNVGIQYTSKQTRSNPEFRIKKRARKVPSDTRTSLISLFGSIVVHSFPTLPRPFPAPSPPSPAPGALALIDLCRADFQNSTNECERTTLTFTGKVFISTPRTPDRRTHRCKFQHRSRAPGPPYNVHTKCKFMTLSANALCTRIEGWRRRGPLRGCRSVMRIAKY